MAALSWGREAEMLGSLMMVAAGDWVSSPRRARSSSAREKAARMRPASEMSAVPTLTPARWAKPRTTGRKEWVASIGASSVQV